MNQRSLYCALWLLAFVTVPAAHADTAPSPPPTDLQPHFVVGQTARYEIWTVRRQDTTMTLGARQQSGTNEFEVTGVMTWQVESVNADRTARCRMSFEWLAATFRFPDGSVKVCDSRQATGDIELSQRLLTAMCGPVIQVDMAADGSVQGVQGVDAIRQRAGADVEVPEDLDFVESASDLATVPFAPASVIAGSAWNSGFTWTHELGRMQHQARYTLGGLEEIAGIGTATVQFTSALTLDVDRSKLPPNSERVDIRMASGSAQGQIMFDLQRHEAVGRNSIQTTRIETRIPIPSGEVLSRVTDETVQSQALRIAEE